MKNTTLIVLCFLFIVPLYAQKKNSKKIDLENLDYKRSSLYIMMAENPSMPYAKASYDGFYNSPFPEKYNNHTVGPKSFNFSSIKVDITNADIASQNAVDALLGKGVLDVAGLDKKIAKYAENKRVAAAMVAKWFDRDSKTGNFNTNLISERGFYDASDLEVAIAKKQAIGTSSLGDAGEQLIGKTFLTVNKFTAIDNKVLPQAIVAGTVLEEAKKMKAGSALEQKAKQIAVKTAQKAYDKLASGYSMVTQAFLYQLVWNDSIQSVFYEELWVDESTLDQERQDRVEAFNNTDLFKLKFVGKGKTTMAGPYYPGKKNGNEADIIAEGTIQSLDKSYNKLALKYADFAVKVPLLTGGKKPTAQIGMKEGVKNGDEYDVFEQRFDQKNNKTIYTKVATIKVDGKKGGIWDNRYSVTDKSDEDESSSFTTFKGGSKKLYPGMLIQQKTKNK